VLNQDGSLDLCCSTSRPEREANWLPAPPGPFNLILRIHWPKQEVLDGACIPPPVVRA